MLKVYLECVSTEITPLTSEHKAATKRRELVINPQQAAAAQYPAEFPGSEQILGKF